MYTLLAAMTVTWALAQFITWVSMWRQSRSAGATLPPQLTLGQMHRSLKGGRPSTLGLHLQGHPSGDYRRSAPATPPSLSRADLLTPRATSRSTVPSLNRAALARCSLHVLPSSASYVDLACQSGGHARESHASQAAEWLPGGARCSSEACADSDDDVLTSLVGLPLHRHSSDGLQRELLTS